VSATPSEKLATIAVLIVLAAISFAWLASSNWEEPQ
jgi:hypothetical protein